ncbi:MAG: TlpA family protein disulfide reductase [Planctomycetes bacterium]|nr:TlpA family protein disulfide reductase [Planctomycetota bacterium]
MSRIFPFLLLAAFGALSVRSSRVPSQCAFDFPALLTSAGGGTEIAAQRAAPGILNKPAPGWGVKKWLNLADGVRSLDVSDFKGKVLYLYCFQSWCPGCHSHGFPTLQKMIKRYQGNDDVVFVAVQTVFEGFGSNTFEHAKRIAKRYDLDIPIGQSGENGKRSPLMRAYRTGGTPWTVIIDRNGVVRFNDFHAKEPQASELIDRLLED